tara:strand:- start:798 stop:1493 length:696 start_codon:yes stop_codon:yes gene_type:complete
VKLFNVSKKTINHVAIIMDGNGRWAAKKKLSKKNGHESGIRNCISLCKKIGKLKYSIKEISFYVFSTENWGRSRTEITNLFELIELFYSEFESTANEFNLRIRHYGSRKKLSKKILKIIDDVTDKTKKNSGTYVNLLFNYGSRQEISDAIHKIKHSEKPFKDLRRYMYIPESLDPDLIIRTGGEKRLSNFMLWQSAYSELYFVKTLWPDFKVSHLNKALNNFTLRNRKHGR